MPMFNFNSPSSNYLKFLALGVLIPYFLFNIGFMFEVTKSELYDVVDAPSSGALSSYRMDMKVSNAREQAVIDWLPGVIDESAEIYGDQYAWLSLTSSLYRQAKVLRTDTDISEDAYIFLRTWNIDQNEAVFLTRRGEHIRFRHISFDELPELYGIIVSRNLIYSNGSVRLLAP